MTAETDAKIIAECEALEPEDASLVALMGYGSINDTEQTAKSLPENSHSLDLLNLAKRLVDSLKRTGKLTALQILNREIQRRNKLETLTPSEGWEVISSEEANSTSCILRGDPWASMRGAVGLKTLTQCAEVFNRNGSKPGKKLRILCAADAKNAADYLQKRSHHSPELPIEIITPTSKTMSNKASAPVEPTAPIVQLFPASHFVRFPTNRTIDEEAIVRMRDSIKDVGIINPIIARAIPGQPELEIIAGETRWLGCKRIDPEFMIPTFLRELSDKEAAKIHAIDNFQREGLNALEEGNEIQHMLDCGWNFDEVMAHLGKAKDYLYTRLTLIKMPDAGKSALLEGNLSLRTAQKIMMLPETDREKAITAVTEPKHAASALPEREARELIEREFIRPAEKAAMWEEKKKLLLKENPGAVWLEYPKASKATINFTIAANRPGYGDLSDAARENELVVPTWRQLAKKHGAELYLGLNYQGLPDLFVSTGPIIDAEKASMDNKPEECIFTHPKAVQKTRDAAEKRKLEEANRREASFAEIVKMQRLILSPDGIKAPAYKKLIERTYEHLLECNSDKSDLMVIFEIDSNHENFEAKLDAAVLKYLRSKAFSPMEAYTRLTLATALEPSWAKEKIVSELFECGAIKAVDFPVNHAAHEEQKVELEKHLAELAEREARGNQEKADRIARGEEEAA